MRLEGRLISVGELSQGQRGEMFELMDRHYANVSHATFETDLAEKHWVIQVLRQGTGELCGFSTQMIMEVSVESRPIKVLFSGDTIIDRSEWGDAALMHVSGRLALSLIDQSPDTELYWFLISQGYKTYRFLPVFFHEFYPRFDSATPVHIGNTIDALGRRKFPNKYDAAARIVRAQANQYRLREGIAELTQERLRDPHVRFFAEQNPGHALGDELCCIAPLSRKNLTPAAYRVIAEET